jgi:Na+-translocating ferredoxin:NAD+ oxidoreductase RnfC subunit
MSKTQIILRVSATYHLNVEVGDKVHRGERLREGPNEDGRSVAPVSGIVKSIQFDAGNHEFVLVIAPAT